MNTQRADGLNAGASRLLASSFPQKTGLRTPHLVPTAVRPLGTRKGPSFPALFVGVSMNMASRPGNAVHALASEASSSVSFQEQPDLDTPTAGFDSIASALEAMARGEHLVVLDDEDRENEGKGRPRTLFFTTPRRTESFTRLGAR